ncbi:CdsA CDP-diglyceride synthetase [Rhabdaerophilaceae bacterium]
MPTGSGETEPKPQKVNDLVPRIVSAVVLAAGALGSAIVGGWIFAFVWSLMAILVFSEWFAMAGGQGEGARQRKQWVAAVGIVFLALVAFLLSGILINHWGAGWLIPLTGGTVVAYAVLVWRAGVRHRRWQAAGMFYAGGLLVSVLILRLSDTHGLVAILFLFAIVWGADVGAYFTGRALGGPKLAPRISPNKTWSGFAGGVVVGVLAGWLVIAVAGVPVVPGLIGVAVGIAVVSVAGDLFESHMKRHFGVKDSGRLIPGHGGFMDRLDAFLFAAIFAVFVGVSRGGIRGAGAGLLSGW